MYCDRNGRPDPNGQYEKIGAKVLLRNGGYVGFDVMSKDAAMAGGRAFLSDTLANLNDAERTFADSAEGRAAVSKALREHALRYAHKGPQAPAFTDTQALSAVKAAIKNRAPKQRTADANPARAGIEAARRARLARLNCR